MKPYYILAVKRNDKWGCEHTSFKREDCVAVRDNLLDGADYLYTMILRSDPEHQDACDLIEVLNTKGW